MYRVWDERYLKKNNTFANSGDFISGVSISGGIGFRGAFNINAGSNITLTQVGSNSLTISSAGGGGGSSTNGVTGITISGSNAISGAINFNAGQNVLLGINGNNITINATGANSDNIAILFGSKELFSGSNNETVTFPSPFATTPKVLANIYNSSGQDILGFQLSGITTNGFSINLSETIPGTGYNLNYFASTGNGLYTFGQSTVNDVINNNYNLNSGSGLFIFQTDIQSGVSEQFINFPTTLDSNPTVIYSIKNNDFNTILGSQISGTFNTGYRLIFSDNVPYTGYKVFTFVCNATGTGLATTVIINNIYNTENIVFTTGNQLISGQKTFITTSGEDFIVSGGIVAGGYSQSGFVNTAIQIGYELSKKNKVSNAVQIGYQVGTGIDGPKVIQIGYQAGQNALLGEGSVQIGYQAGQNSLVNGGGDAIQIGNQAGKNCLNAVDAIQIGPQAALNSVTADGAVQIGFRAGLNAFYVNNAVQIGAGAGASANNATSTVQIGQAAGQFSTNATGAVQVGSLAGQNARSGNHTTFIGASADALSSDNNVSGSIAIGYQAKVSGPNMCVIGGINNYSVNVAINNNSPTSRLDVSGNISASGANFNGDLRFTGAFSTTPINNSGSTFNLGTNLFYIHTGYNINDLWILPSISSSNGRFYYLKNKGNSLILSGNSATEYLFTHQRVQTVTMLSGNSLTLANDGQDWSVFNNTAGEDWGEI